MGSREDIDDDDDDFSELYKAYTGPVGSKPSNSQEKTNTNKRSLAGSDDEEKEKDPNAVPTDFTSREAKFWEAKSKATEKNWKKRKEEEMICKLCGESGHFTQGCPSTLGANRKSQDFFERVAAREPRVKALFTEQVVNQLEKDIGCKIKIEEKFIIVSGKDRLILKKGVDAVHKIKEDGEVKGPSSQPPRSKSPVQRSPVSSRSGRFDSQRSNPGPPAASQFQNRFSRQEKAVEDRVREDLQKLTRGSPQAYEGARSHSSRSRSPARAPSTNNAHNLYPHSQVKGGGYRMDSWDAERRSLEKPSGRRSDHPLLPCELEEIASEYQKEATELGRVRDKEEEEENYKHREAMREIRENYVKNMTVLRGSHAREWEEFLQFNVQKRQQQASSAFSGGYRQSNYPEYDNSSAAEPPYPRNNMPMDSRDRYPMESSYHSSRPHDYYADLQHQRHEDYGKAYNNRY